jgi:hypothetical protein
MTADLSPAIDPLVVGGSSADLIAAISAQQNFGALDRTGAGGLRGAQYPSRAQSPPRSRPHRPRSDQ